MIKDVESNTRQYFPSDHFPLELRLKIKLSKHRGRPPDKSNDWKNTQKLPQKPRNTSIKPLSNHIKHGPQTKKAKTRKGWNKK